MLTARILRQAAGLQALCLFQHEAGIDETSELDVQPAKMEHDCLRRFFELRGRQGRRGNGLVLRWRQSGGNACSTDGRSSSRSSKQEQQAGAAAAAKSSPQPENIPLHNSSISSNTIKSQRPK